VNTRSVTEVDKKLLLDIFQIGSMSQIEYDMVDFVCKYLDDNNIPYNKDKNNNIWSLNNIGRPLLSAHLDTVQDSDDYALAGFAKIKGNILRSYGVLGGDDKAGIYAILHVLNERPDVNFVFFVEEEIGGSNGSTYWTKMNGKEVEENVPWSIVIDRRGNSDILCYDHFGTYGTEEFQNALLSVGKKYGLSSTHGSVSDADKLKYHISSANISAGYYNPHSKNEFVYIPDLMNIVDFLIDCVDSIKDTFEAPSDDFFNNYDFDYDYNYFDRSDYEYTFPTGSSLDDELINDATSGDKIKENGTVKYFINSLKGFYSSKELDDIILEIIDIQQENGRIL